MLPLTIGTFIGAWKVLEWHWILAALFAAPGLVLSIPGVLSKAFGRLSSGEWTPLLETGSMPLPDQKDRQPLQIR